MSLLKDLPEGSTIVWKDELYYVGKYFVTGYIKIHRLDNSESKLMPENAEVSLVSL